MEILNRVQLQYQQNPTDAVGSSSQIFLFLNLPQMETISLSITMRSKRTQPKPGRKWNKRTETVHFSAVFTTG